MRSGQKEFSSQRSSASNLLATPKKRPLGSSSRITLSSGRHSSLGILDTPTKRQLVRTSDSESRSDRSELRLPGFELGTPSKRQGRVYSTIHSLHHAYRLGKRLQKHPLQHLSPVSAQGVHQLADPHPDPSVDTVVVAVLPAEGK